MEDIKDINNPLRIEMRRYRSLMEICSLCIVAFAVWSIIKFFLQLMTDPEEIFSAESGSAPLYAKVVTLSVVIILITVDLLIRLYIARTALLVSKDLISKTRYSVFAVFLIFEGLVGIVLEVKAIINDPSNALRNIVSIMLEITSLGAVFGLIYAGMKFRKARNSYKQLSQNGQQDDGSLNV